MTIKKNLGVLLEPSKTQKAPKILTLDIETAPGLAYFFDTWGVNIYPDMIVENPRMLCFAAKWYGSSKVEFYSEYHDGTEEMRRQAWRLLNEADIVVTYNGDKFDAKWLRTELFDAGLSPTSPFISVDLLKTGRAQFKFPSNRLGYVAERIGIGAKIHTGGVELWKAVLRGEEKAWAKFKRYNIQDVRLTEDLMVALGPWIKGFPHTGLWSGNTSACYRCGSTRLENHGVTYTKTSIYPKYLCLDCGAWNKTLRNGQTRAAV